MSPRRSRKSSPARFILLGLAGAVVALALAALALAAWAGSYLRGPEFRAMVAEHAGKALRGRAELGPLRWDGSGVFSEAFRLKGEQGAPLSALEARQIRASVDWRSILSGSWKVPSVEILEIEAAFTPAAADSPPSPPSGTASLPHPRRAQRLEVGRFRAARASLDFGAAGALRDTKLVLENEGKAWGFAAAGGRYLLPGWPDVLVESLRGRVAAGSLHLTSGTGHLESGGRLEASGEFGRESRLRLEWADVNTESLLPKPWRERLQGVVGGNATLDILPGGATARGKFLLQDGRLRDVPLLGQIASFTGSPQFRRMPLQTVSADFRHDASGWAFSNVELESKGLLRITGEFTVAAGGGLEGAFEVGVAPQVLQWIPGSRERVFTRNAEGYVWTPMRLGGTVENPREDLSGRLAAAARDEIIQRGADALQKPAEAARGLLDALSPLLR